MENTFEKFIESKNFGKEPESLTGSFSQMIIDKHSVSNESLKMVSETLQKYEERSDELLAEKNYALKKKSENLSRRKSKETEEALRSFNSKENQIEEQNLELLLEIMKAQERKTAQETEELLQPFRSDEYSASKTDTLKKKFENLGRRKSKETEEALCSFNSDENDKLALAQRNAALKKKTDSLNARKLKANEETLRSFNSKENQIEEENSEILLEIIKARERKAAALKKKNELLINRKFQANEEALRLFNSEENQNLEGKVAEQIAQENMLLERRMKHQSQQIPRNLNESNEFFLNKNTAEELKILKADAKKLKKEKEAKKSKEETSRLFAERTQKLNLVYSPDKIGMTADSIVNINTSKKNQNSILSSSTTYTGVLRSTGAIKSK